MLVLVLALMAGCKAKEEKKPAVVEKMAPEEIQRDQDACKAYVDKICACTVPDAKKQCELARALPEAIRIGLEVAASPDSKPDVVRQSLDGVRKTAKECIEQIAKLPAMGCQ